MCSSQSCKSFLVDHCLFANTKYLSAKISLKGTVKKVHSYTSNVCVFLYIVNTNLHSIATIIDRLLVCSKGIVKGVFSLFIIQRDFVPNYIIFKIFRPAKMQRFEDDDKSWTPKSIIQQGIGLYHRCFSGFFFPFIHCLYSESTSRQ